MVEEVKADEEKKIMEKDPMRVLLEIYAASKGMRIKEETGNDDDPDDDDVRDVS